MKNVYRQSRPHYLMRFCAAISLLLLLAAIDSGAAGDPSAGYPSRPIEYVVHNAPGAGTDILGRMICDIIQ
jgi:tripartite-type tricarboxylate transporter receptor subunit TctC